MIILITGCCGFIGSHLTDLLLNKGRYKLVIGLDNMNDYYDINLKEKNLEILKKYKNFLFLKEDIVNTKVIEIHKPDIVIHLASLAGVRNSLLKPIDYAKVNICGMINLLEQCKNNNINKFIYASSSSVYGCNEKIPYSENDITDKLNSPYATSKKCMELYAQTYNQLYNINMIGLRFFTVYGPRGRPDMAPYKFLNNIINNKEIIKYGSGNSYRDYTYINDIVNGINLCIEKNIIGNKVYNLGNGNPINLNNFIKICEEITGKKAKIKEINEQKGDVPKTYCDINKSREELGYEPKIKLKEGLKKMYESL